jgi:hypothetical protein
MRLRPRIRLLAALALLGVLSIGAAGHAWHHLTDHACESSAAPEIQPCATCAALHGGTIVSDPQHDAPGQPVVLARVSHLETIRPLACLPASAPPRAPPVA